jgi:hypothetical protein
MGGFATLVVPRGDSSVEFGQAARLAEEIGACITADSRGGWWVTHPAWQGLRDPLYGANLCRDEVEVVEAVTVYVARARSMGGLDQLHNATQNGGRIEMTKWQLDDVGIKYEVALEILGQEKQPFVNALWEERRKASPSEAVMAYCKARIAALDDLQESLRSNDAETIGQILDKNNKLYRS